MKKSVKRNLAEMRNLAKNMPKTINEVLQFEASEDNMNDFDDEMAAEEEAPVEEPAAEQETPDVRGNATRLIDDIRKKALRAMADLADSPESPEYINLKAIWRLCDKSVSEKQEERETLAKNDNNSNF